MIIADTDVLVDFLRGKGSGVDVERYISLGTLCVTAITVFELWAGAHSNKQKTAVGRLLDAIPVVALSSEAARRAGDLHKGLEKKGERIGMADSLIAGMCLEVGASLLTNNKRHFCRIADLNLL